MARIGGSRRKRLGVFTKSSRDKGKISQRAYLQSFQPGDKVILQLEPGIQHATYPPRLHGKTGIVKKRQGECYAVAVKDGAKTKEAVVHPVHLRKA
ncbi:50S ribosomal protein L21e [Candidatus Woesearchaeota archaeon]|nr:50S ribosomal protein L21e [Candidatus Woesearchaeota archaeon]